MPRKKAAPKLPMPETGKLCEVNEEICLKCGYHQVMGGTLCVCDYILMTGKMRGCKSGWCDKFKKTAKKNDKIFGHF